jgi:hypothetical protein
MGLSVKVMGEEEDGWNLVSVTVPLLTVIKEYARDDPCCTESEQSVMVEDCCEEGTSKRRKEEAKEDEEENEGGRANQRLVNDYSVLTSINPGCVL